MTETILQAAVLTVLVLVLRRLLRGRVRQRTVYLLWLPVLLRLVLPGIFFTLPVQTGTRGAVTQAAERLQTVMDGLSMEPVRVSGAAPHAAQFAAIDAQAVFVTVWNLGSVLLLIWIFAVNFRFAHKLKRERVLLPACGKLPVYTVPALPSPCLALAGGRLGIYLPETLAAEPEQLRHILAHETAHARRFDHIWELFRLGLAVLYWWNPLVWLAISCSRQDGELACDEAALETLGESERLRYGHTLVALAERCTNRRGFACAASMSRGGRALRERIRQVAHRPEPSKMAALLAVLLLTLGSAAAFTTAPAADAPSPSTVEIQMMGDPAQDAPSMDDRLAAAEVVRVYLESHPVWQSAVLRYDAAYDQKQCMQYLEHGGGAEEGYTADNVIVLLCDFTAGEGPVLEPGERYTDYNFILARRSASEPWEIVDQGY